MTSNVEQTLLTCPCQAEGAQLTVTGRTYVANFTGHLTLGFDPSVLAQYQQGAVKLMQILIHDHVSHGVGAEIGAISVVKDPDRDPGPSSLTPIRPAGPFPAVQDMLVNIHVDIPALLPGIKLRNVIPANPGPPILRNNNVMSFPPQNDVYHLVEPIDLEDLNNPGPVLATINAFPVTVGPPTG